MTFRQKLAAINRESINLKKEKERLKHELDEVMTAFIQRGFFKSTHEINRLKLIIKQTELKKQISELELKSELIKFKFQDVQNKYKMVKRAEKLISQMKLYKGIITSKKEIDFEERKIQYCILYGMCESLNITINFADFLFRTTYFANETREDFDNLDEQYESLEFLNENQKFLIRMIEKIDFNLINNEKYLDIISFEDNEVIEESMEIDKDKSWFNW